MKRCEHLIVVLLLGFISQQECGITSRSARSRCTILPAPTLSRADPRFRSLSQTHAPSHEDKLQEILSQGMDQLPLEKHNKTAIFVLGNTGSGKTTVTQILNGDLSHLHAVLTHRGRLVVIDDNDRIGPPTTASKTLVPEYVVNPETNVSFYDCPGFDDNRGAEMDVAAMYFINSITEHVNQTKLLFTVIHSSVIPGNDRIDFDLLATHASQFIQNMTNFANSIGLVVTKVNSYSEIDGLPMEDEEIMFGIVEFLDQYLLTLQSQLNQLEGLSQSEQQLVERKIQFVQAILGIENKDRSWGNGEDSKLWFIKNPPKCGKFSEIPYISQVRNKILDMVTNKMVYVASKPSYFGMTLKAETRLKIQNEYVPQILKRVQNSTVQVFSDLTERYNSFLEKRLTDKYQIGGALSKLEQVEMNLRRQNETNIQKLFDVVDYTAPESFTNEARKAEEVLKFYEKVTGMTIQRPSLEFALVNLQARIKSLRESTLNKIREQLAPTILAEMEYGTNKTVSELLFGYKIVFENEFKSVNMSIMSKALTKLKAVSVNLNTFVESKINTQIVYKDIPTLFQILEYPIPETYLDQQRDYEISLNIYENVTNVAFERPTYDFRITEVQTQIENLKENTWKIINDVKIPLLVSNLDEKLVKFVANFKKSYESEFEEEFSSSDYLMRLALLKLNDIYAKLRDFVTLQNNYQTFSTKVQRLFDAVESPLAVPNLSLLRNDEELLDFYENLTAANLIRPTIDMSLAELQTFLGNMRLNKWKYVEDVIIPNIFSEISENVTKFVRDVETFYLENFYGDLNRERIATKLEGLQGLMGQLEELKERWGEMPPWEYNVGGSSQRLSFEIGELYFILGNMTVEASALDTAEEHLNFLGRVMNTEIKSPGENDSGFVLKGPMDLIKKLGDVLKWYEFLVKLEIELESNGVNKNELKALQSLTNGSSSTLELVEHLETLRAGLVLTEIIENAKNPINVKDGILLKEIIENVLKYHQTEIQCLVHERKAVVTGNHVKVTHFMGSSGSALPCSNSTVGISELEIVASEAVVFDGDILAKGKNLTVRIIAPKWEVVGAKRTVDLSGEDAVNSFQSLKAEGGSAEDKNGRDGAPGGPGGNGGSFYGIYGNVVNGEQLSISVSGGNGGNGQDGGDGLTGADEKPVIVVPYKWDYALPKDGVSTAGGNSEESIKGGNGGSGGSGGEGGYPGNLTMTHVHPDSVLEQHHNGISFWRRRGRSGGDGKGGKGGSGGKKVKGTDGCQNLGLLFEGMGCIAAVGDDKGPVGQNGVDGGNSVGKISAVKPPQIKGVIWDWETILDFKRFVVETGSGTGLEFSMRLDAVQIINIKNY